MKKIPLQKFHESRSRRRSCSRRFLAAAVARTSSHINCCSKGSETISRWTRTSSLFRFASAPAGMWDRRSIVAVGPAAPATHSAVAETERRRLWSSSSSRPSIDHDRYVFGGGGGTSSTGERASKRSCSLVLESSLLLVLLSDVRCRRRGRAAGASMVASALLVPVSDRSSVTLGTCWASRALQRDRIWRRRAFKASVAWLRRRRRIVDGIWFEWL